MNALQQLRRKGRVIRAAAYARFSSDNQREESIDAQLRAIHEYAARNEIVIVKEYIDRARSATTDNRPSFLEMIKESVNHEFDIIIVHKLDRFARNRYDSAHYCPAKLYAEPVAEHIVEAAEKVAEIRI